MRHSYPGTLSLKVRFLQGGHGGDDKDEPLSLLVPLLSYPRGMDPLLALKLL